MAILYGRDGAWRSHDPHGDLDDQDHHGANRASAKACLAGFAALNRREAVLHLMTESDGWPDWRRAP